MQKKETSTMDDELIDVLIAISVISKRLAEKLKSQIEDEE